MKQYDTFMNQGLLFGSRLKNNQSYDRFVVTKQKLLEALEIGLFSPEQFKALAEVGDNRLQNFYTKPEIPLFLQVSHYPPPAKHQELANVKVLVSVELETSLSKERLARGDLSAPLHYQCGIALVPKGISGYLEGEVVSYMAEPTGSLQLFNTSFEAAIDHLGWRVKHMNRQNIYGFKPKECAVEEVSDYAYAQIQDKVRNSEFIG